MGFYKNRLNYSFLQLINLAKRKIDSPKVYRVWFKDIKNPKYLKILY